MRAGGYDAIVIGGGHNGLVAACTLARAGKRTLLLEASDTLGGMAAQAPTMCGLAPKFVKDFKLAAHGLAAPPRLETASLLPDGQVLRLSPSDPQATRQSIAQFSARDGERYGPFRARMARLSGALAPFLDRTPPRISAETWSERLGLAGFALALRRMGRDDMRDLMRIIGMNVWDLTDEVFESEPLRGLVCFDAVLGNMFGPRSPNTVFTLLHRTALGEPVLPPGGVASLIDALEKAARANGVEIRTAVRVARIEVVDERVTGITLDDGTTLEANLILSSAHPKATLLDMVGPAHLDADYAREVRLALNRGANARVDLSVEAAPPKAIREALGRGRIVVAPDPDMLERCFDAAKFGELPERLPLEAVSPTLLAGGDGRHVVSITLQYAPARAGCRLDESPPSGGPHPGPPPRGGREQKGAPSLPSPLGREAGGGVRLARGDLKLSRSSLKDAEWADHRDDLVARAIAALEPNWPGLGKAVVEATATTPQDIAAASGSPGGHWHHLELGLHQAFMLRPVPGWAQYRTPVAGLYLCGAGTHPGGGLSGRPGANGARQALADLKGRRR